MSYLGRDTRFEYGTVDEQGTKEGSVTIAQLGNFDLLPYEIDLIERITKRIEDRIALEARLDFELGGAA